MNGKLAVPTYAELSKVVVVLSFFLPGTFALLIAINSNGDIEGYRCSGIRKEEETKVVEFHKDTSQ